MPNFLRIAQWNANGLTQHKDEVQLFLQRTKIDILLVLRPGHPYRSRYHPQKKQQAPSQTTVSSKPTPANNIKGQYSTETETEMAN